MVVNDEVRDVYKRPITDSGKDSKRGRLKLVQREQGLVTVGESEPGEDLLVPVFANGQLLRKQTLAEVRGRAKIGL